MIFGFFESLSWSFEVGFCNFGGCSIAFYGGSMWFFFNFFFYRKMWGYASPWGFCFWVLEQQRFNDWITIVCCILRNFAKFWCWIANLLREPPQVHLHDKSPNLSNLQAVKLQKNLSAEPRVWNHRNAGFSFSFCITITWSNHLVK